MDTLESGCTPCGKRTKQHLLVCGSSEFQRLVHLPLGELLGRDTYVLKHAPDNSYYYLTIPDTVIDRRHIFDAFFKNEDKNVLFIADVHTGMQVVAAGPLELVQFIAVAHSLASGHSYAETSEAP